GLRPQRENGRNAPFQHHAQTGTAFGERTGALRRAQQYRAHFSFGASLGAIAFSQSRALPTGSAFLLIRWARELRRLAGGGARNSARTSRRAGYLLDSHLPD